VATYVAKVNEGSAGDLNLIGWTGDYADPDNFVGTFFNQRTAGAQFGFSNPKIFNLLLRAKNEGNFQKRVRLYQKLNVLLMNYLPAIPYAHATPALGSEKRVHNLIATPTGGVWFQYATVG
jgi:peptide/nickel transport system substrate-binding protein